MEILKCSAAHIGSSRKRKCRLFGIARKSTRLLSLAVTLLIAGFLATRASAEPPRFSQVVPDVPLVFPQDFGAHPDFRNEWWYVTGWLETPDKKPLGFQVTFFRVATEHNRSNPSRFAPNQLIIAHAALSDPEIGKLLHDQKSAREGLGLAYTKEGDTDVKLGDWYMLREENGRYQTTIKARDFTLRFSLTPTQKPMLQDDNGFSHKGPRPEQASYYYSEPQLQVTGTVTHNDKEMAVKGIAWLDHEWSTAYLDPSAEGWDWVGANLDDGSSLMAFLIRGKDGRKVWAYAGIRDAAGHFTRFEPEQVSFQPQRTWRSPHTDAVYPVEMRIQTGSTVWLLTPLQDDQELDSRQSTGAVYWEGAVRISRDGRPAGRGYFEMTGYVESLKL
ncbi:Predicted secreted hydrolase [Nitrosospira sp. Nsp18]|uniref:lipocalin-like domain-containing protein n=1 Tax=Nitrosospira sp. Nsp18 TaxID=1855334 RepID=UPI0008922789|nr:lipocalin-like domain-containing protein [Nitrosospira sp. Nsp18]SDA23637.1 Predicted secreted hydrolase [Nitrosospira sp. Nsp18]